MAHGDEAQLSGIDVAAAPAVASAGPLVPMTRVVVALLSLVLVAAPLAVEAQQAGKVGEQRSIRLRALVAAGHPTKRKQAPVKLPETLGRWLAPSVI